MLPCPALYRGEIVRRRVGTPWLLLIVAPVLLVAAAVWVVLGASGVTLSGDEAALASIHLQTFAGSLESARATTPAGRPVPLAVHDGRLTPKVRVTPGERIDVEVVVRRPGALSWALGDTRREHLTITTPVVRPTTRWVTTPHGSAVTVAFDGTVAGEAAHGHRAGARCAPRGPRGPRPSAHRLPAAASRRCGSVQLTFAQTVHDAIGDAEPTLTPKTPGRFTRPDAHTLLFTPSGDGFGVGTGTVHMTLPKTVALVAATGTTTTKRIGWTVPPPSTLRLEQLLAQGGYLPLDWQPSGDDVPRTRAAQANASVDAPDGTFTWRFTNTPAELKREWKVGEANEIVRGAIMKLQDTHHLTVDAFAGPAVWRALVADTIAGRRRTDGYSYVYVHRDTPQLLTLWHDGHTVLTSPGNTGVPAAPTELGTFPVFEHLASTTMSGTNPDGSHYDDPGVKWVSYFNGGDALHAFNRASFGTPQSLGCVELPEASAKKVWPYTPIGTLVTIEH